MQTDVEETIQTLIHHFDKHPQREGLRDTPKRYSQFLSEFLKPKPFKVTTFNNDGYDEMIVQTHIPFYSICEHHLVPFFGEATLAYIPAQKLIGLSKLALTLDHFSHQFQLQERITNQVAEFLVEALKPKGVGVMLSARHLCMEMRGLQTPGILNTTSCLKGYFKTNQSTRSEFLHIAHG